MYYRITETLELLKTQMPLSEEQISTILESGYFKNLINTYSEISDNGMAATMRLNNTLEEPLMSDILMQALHAIGEKDYIPELIKLTQDPPKSLEDKTDYNLIEAFYKCIDRHLKFIAMLGKEINLDSFVEYMAMFGVKRATEKFDILDWQDRINGIVEKYKDMHIFWEIYNNKDDEKLPNCQEELQEDAKISIKILTKVYNLKKEQVLKLIKCRYKEDKRLPNTTAGVYQHLSNLIRVNPTSSRNRIQILMHEMLHSLGINSEGVVELLSQWAFFKSYEDVFAYDKNELSFDDRDSYVSNMYYNKPFVPNKSEWSYFSVSSRFYELFLLFERNGLSKKVLEIWISGNSFPFIHLMPELYSFYSASSMIQEEYYKNEDKNYTLINRCEGKCDEALKDSESELMKLKLKIQDIQKEINGFSNEMTLESFIKLKEDLFSLIFSEPGKKFKQSVINGTAKQDLKNRKKLYITNVFSSGFECLQTQVEDFNRVIELLLKKVKAPKNVKNFLISLDDTKLKDEFYILKKSYFKYYLEEPPPIDIYDSYAVGLVADDVCIDDKVIGLYKLDKIPEELKIKTSDTIKSVIEKYNVACHSRKSRESNVAEH
ncbi:MAG: hypothetical protein IJS47_06830 [Clostridia bacterium]|nr:hypothetical protein [Clostridia bacterium]